MGASSKVSTRNHLQTKIHLANEDAPHFYRQYGVPTAPTLKNAFPKSPHLRYCSSVVSQGQLEAGTIIDIVGAPQGPHMVVLISLQGACSSYLFFFRQGGEGVCSDGDLSAVPPGSPHSSCHCGGALRR